MDDKNYQEYRPEKPTKIEVKAYLDKPKKGTDQEGAGVSNSQVQNRDVETQTQDVETQTQDVETQTQDIETQTQDVETQTQDVETQTENSETATQNVETQIDPSPKELTVMGRQEPLQLPPRLRKVKREKIQNPYFSPEVDKPPSESKTAPLPEEAIDFEITSQAKAKTEGTIIEEPSVQPQAAVQSYEQQIAISVSPHVRIREDFKTGPKVGFKVASLVLIGAAVCTTLIALQFRAGRSIDSTAEPDTNDKDKKKLSPSIFIFIYLSRDKAQLNQWLVVTRNLLDIDDRVRKFMIGQVVAIVDSDRDGVIIEIFIEEFEFFSPFEQNISPFKKLSKESTLKMERKLSSELFKFNRFFSLLKVIMERKLSSELFKSNRFFSLLKVINVFKK